MLDYFLSFLAVLAMSPTPVVGFNPAQAYGQDVAVAPVLVQSAVKSEQAEIVKAPRKNNPDNVGVAVSGRSAFVADVQSGAVLFAKAPHDVHSIASLTKLMTAIVVMESDTRLDGDLSLVRSDFDYRSSADFRVNDTIAKDAALRAMLVGSVNELAAAFSRSSGMSEEEFVLRMNQKAKELHLASLQFVDPTGLEPANKGSAADIAALITIALRYSEIRSALNSSVVELTTKEGKVYKIDSTNLLLTSFLNEEPYSIVGGKTGSLPEAGYCLAQVTRRDDGHEVVTVLLGSDNHFERFKDVKVLTYWAFDSYTW